jgi:peptidoglycan/xylan/chitin deacetylase (PgdA/CDA1 family)
VLVAAHAAPALAMTMPGRWLFPAIHHVAAPQAVALTFDDGPDHALEAFLVVLAAAGAQATFFVTGEQVVRAPGRVAEIIGAGHQVGVHGYRHRHHLRLTPWQVREDLRRAREVIEAASGRPTTLFRPPYGGFSLASWREAGRQRWQRVLWSRWGRDWEPDATQHSIVARIGQPQAGDILLLHDSDRYSAPGSWRNTLAALPLVLERIAAAGLVARAVGTLLADSGSELPHPRVVP